MPDTLSTGIPRVDPTATPAAWKQVLLNVVASTPGTVVHRVLAARLDGPLMRMTGGRFNLALGSAPLVVLKTTGAKTGAPREAPLLYFTDGDDVVLMASSYGRTKHPAWYRNLVAHPVCELSIGRRGGSYVAHETAGAERERLFALAERYYKGYGAYAERTDGVRTIPVLRLTPA